MFSGALKRGGALQTPVSVTLKPNKHDAATRSGAKGQTYANFADVDFRRLSVIFRTVI
ncbi:hypothetical protein PSP6_50058 [Paraburkholderia tropica]|nr:hypothetical protein PSP6_50058 [Paraburkholderia tropica]